VKTKSFVLAGFVLSTFYTILSYACSMATGNDTWHFEKQHFLTPILKHEPNFAPVSTIPSKQGQYMLLGSFFAVVDGDLLTTPICLFGHVHLLLSLLPNPVTAASAPKLLYSACN
jgi:hypothetical protein